jgi:hypothetical protein
MVSVAAVAAAAPARQSSPRIVAAAMQDTDRDARADRVRLTYSARIRHVRDRDGRFPFKVAGYRIASVGPASGKALVILLVEKAVPDTSARPVIRYGRTRSQPVLGRPGAQAVAQVFRSVRPHGHAAPPPSTPATPTTPVVLDTDGDGAPDAKDCGPRDASIHPGAPDRPELSFVDSNCDGIDGTESDSVFVSPNGDDANPGTKEKPKRWLEAAVTAAAADRKHAVLVAAGTYDAVGVVSGVGIYGGYVPDNWSVRSAALVTQIFGEPEGVYAVRATDVELELLSIKAGSAGQAGASAYGIRAVQGSELHLRRVTVTAGPGSVGATGEPGAAGRPGGDGQPGAKGACDSSVKAPGGAGGLSPVGRDGGKGGDGRYEQGGLNGGVGIVGTPGGKGGKDGISGVSGLPGAPGAPGAGGASGHGATSSTTLARETWKGAPGGEGIYGAPGNGGGGGGAGGGQDDFISINGTGNGGGGGGGGGEGGRGGGGGFGGGGSFGVYLVDSTIVAEQSSITSGAGGTGGRGGAGGPGGAGGRQGFGYHYCGSEIGDGARGGDGGRGGQGGGGGGGAGGPSIGIFKLGTAKATLTDTKVAFGARGPGGVSGPGGGSPTAADAGPAQAIFP